MQAAARGQEQEPGQEGDSFQVVDLHSDEEKEAHCAQQTSNICVASENSNLQK